jgi:hypothetical protein
VQILRQLLLVDQLQCDGHTKRSLVRSQYRAGRQRADLGPFCVRAGVEAFAAQARKGAPEAAKSSTVLTGIHIVNGAVRR